MAGGLQWPLSKSTTKKLLVTDSTSGGVCSECSALFERDAVVQRSNYLARVVSEFLPSVLSNVNSGLALGPSSESCGCNDCATFEWALKMKKRIDAGEFEQFKEKT